MSILGHRVHTAGNTTRYILDYSAWLEEDMTLTAATVTSSSTDATVSGTVVNPDKTVYFMLAGGVINELFTLTIQVHDSRGEVKNDTLDFTVVAP